MNKKGIVETGAAIISALIISVSAVAGVGFFSASPTSVAFTSAVTGLTAYSQMPHVKRNFRVRKAINQCETTGSSQCEEMIASWSDDAVLDYIRDDEPAQIVTNGGNFVNGNMNP